VPGEGAFYMTGENKTSWWKNGNKCEVYGDGKGTTEIKF